MSGFSNFDLLAGTTILLLLIAIPALMVWAGHRSTQTLPSVVPPESIRSSEPEPIQVEPKPDILLITQGLKVAKRQDANPNPPEYARKTSRLSIPTGRLVDPRPDPNPHRENAVCERDPMATIIDTRAPTKEQIEEALRNNVGRN